MKANCDDKHPVVSKDKLGINVMDHSFIVSASSHFVRLQWSSNMLKFMKSYVMFMGHDSWLVDVNSVFFFPSFLLFFVIHYYKVNVHIGLVILITLWWRPFLWWLQRHSQNISRTEYKLQGLTMIKTVKLKSMKIIWKKENPSSRKWF